MNSRIIYLDQIRIFLISYVIIGHISVSYGAVGGGNWYYIETTGDLLTKAVLYLVDMFAYSFLMAMFIFIAGYFTPASFERKGPKRFLLERLSRLFIPLVVFYFLIGPLARYVSMLAKGHTGSLAGFFENMYASGKYGYMGVMWFVALILFFTMAYAFFRTLFPEGINLKLPQKFPSNRSILVFVLGLSLASFLLRILFPMGGEYVATRPLASIAFYAVAFIMGTLAWKYQWLESLGEQQAKLWFYIALFFMITPLIMMLALQQTVDFETIRKPGSLASALYSFWEVIKTVGTGMMTLVIFRKYFHTHGRISLAMGRSTFAAYVFHPLVCILLMYAFSGLPLHALLKFAIVAPLGIIGSFGFSWLILRIPGLSRVF
jgi:glucans biosynthesis protein C